MLHADWLGDGEKEEGGFGAALRRGVQKWRKLTSALGTAQCNSFHWQHFKEEEEGDNPPQH